MFRGGGGGGGGEFWFEGFDIAAQRSSLALYHTTLLVIAIFREQIDSKNAHVTLEYDG